MQTRQPIAVRVEGLGKRYGVTENGRGMIGSNSAPGLRIHAIILDRRFRSDSLLEEREFEPPVSLKV
jgi:hypothetical protein